MELTRAVTTNTALAIVNAAASEIVITHRYENLVGMDRGDVGWKEEW